MLFTATSLCFLGTYITEQFTAAGNSLKLKSYISQLQIVISHQQNKSYSTATFT